MQTMLPGMPSGTKRNPTLVVRRLGDERLALRYQNIGDRRRFRIMLQRLQFEFPLAICEELDAQPWWLISLTQHDQVEDFCRRNGLRMVKEG